MIKHDYSLLLLLSNANFSNFSNKLVEIENCRCNHKYSKYESKLLFLFLQEENFCKFMSTCQGS